MEPRASTDNRADRSSKAHAALVLAALVAAILVVASCSKGPFVPLKVGECLPKGAQVEGERAQRPATVSCDESHRYQVFAIVRLKPPSSDWPGEDLVNLNAENLCVAAIKDATGLQPKDTPDDVELLHIDPTEDSWRGGDRDVECLFRWDDSTVSTLVTSGQ